MITVYGDFNCPWSYLAFRRAQALADAGADVEWRAVEHDPWKPGRNRDQGARVAALREEMDRVVAMLGPDETLPYDLTGFVPSTRAAVAAYAESRVAGAERRVGAVIFESFWMHGIDIGDPKVLRTVLEDQLRGTSSPSEAVREWGYPTDITGGPISTRAWRLTVRWSSSWLAEEKGVVPMLVRPDGRPVHGVDAVQWLGEQSGARGAVRAPVTGTVTGTVTSTDTVADRGRDLPDLRWVSEIGGSWPARFRQATPVG